MYPQCLHTHMQGSPQGRAIPFRLSLDVFFGASTALRHSYAILCVHMRLFRPARCGGFAGHSVPLDGAIHMPHVHLEPPRGVSGASAWLMLCLSPGRSHEAKVWASLQGVPHPGNPRHFASWRVAPHRKLMRVANPVCSTRGGGGGAVAPLAPRRALAHRVTQP